MGITLEKGGSTVRSAALLVFLVLVPALSASGLGAQEGGFAFQIRGGRFEPSGDLRDDEVGWKGETRGGVGFGMGFTFPIVGPLGTYVGFGQYRFTCQEGVCPPDEKWESTGFDVALRYVLRQGNRLRPWLQVGLHTHRLRSELQESTGNREAHSHGGGGYEVGGGLLIQVGERMSLSPGIRYGRGEAPYSDRGDIRLRYLVLDLGLVVGF